MSGYWPHAMKGLNPFTNSLAARLLRYLNTVDPAAIPQYIHTKLHTLTSKHILDYPSGSFTLAADFNHLMSHTNGIYPPMTTWMPTYQLENHLWRYAAHHSQSYSPSYRDEHHRDIVHILHRPTPFLTQQAGWVSLLPLTLPTVSDHLLYVADFYVPRGRDGLLTSAPTLSSPLRPLDLPNTHAARTKYSHSLDLAVVQQQLHTTTPSNALLSTIVHLSVTTSRKLSGSPSPRTQKGWESSTIALERHLQFLHTLTAHLHGYLYHTQWRTTQQYREGIPSLIAVWVRALTLLYLPPDKMSLYLVLPHCKPLSFRRDFCTTQRLPSSLLPLIEADITRIKSRIYASKTASTTTDISLHATRQGDLYKAGRLGPIIQSVLGCALPPHKRKFFIPLDCIRVPGSLSRLISDPFSIYHSIRSHFMTYFKLPILSIARPIHSNRMSYRDIRSDRAAFIRAHSLTFIPEPILDLIWEAIVHSQTDSLHDAFTDIFSLPPTFDEFLAAIHTSSRRTAPGATGLTYSMIRARPRAITHIVYQCLVQMWTDKSIPDDWKWRWICLLPKDFGQSRPATDSAL